MVTETAVPAAGVELMDHGRRIAVFFEKT